jgi:hypothetical protein
MSQIGKILTGILISMLVLLYFGYIEQNRIQKIIDSIEHKPNHLSKSNDVSVAFGEDTFTFKSDSGDKRKQTISDIVGVPWEYKSSNSVIAGSDIRLQKALFLREEGTFFMKTGRVSIHRGNWRENGSDQILLDVKTVENPLLPNGQGGGGERRFNLEIKIKILPKSLYEVKNKIHYYRMENEQLKDGRYIGN